MEMSRDIQLIKVNIPFDKKKIALEHGAIFEKGNDTRERGFYIPVEKQEEFRTLLSQTQENNTTRVAPLSETQPQDEGHRFVDNSAIQEKEIAYWDEKLATKEEFILAFSLKKNGLPPLEEQRTKLLQLLNQKEHGHYRFSYENLCEMSNIFYHQYSTEYVQTLITKTITGAKPFLTEIRESSLTEEEKALLELVLPL